MIAYPPPMNDAERWNDKYSSGRWNQNSDCDAFVIKALDELGEAEGRSALDLASGPGRHALELAERGWQTSAWDVSPVGLDLLRDRTAQAGLEIARRVIDLSTEFDSITETFDLIVVVNYLDRDLFARLSALLRPSGHLVLTTFTKEHGRGHPSPRHCLEPGELARGIPGMTTVLCEEQGGRAGLFAKL
ncbi:MAG: tellurite methyltransferase [Planctomycetota bacterium]|jgi:tellurite methyltransferase